jgi:hypothetical protein
MPRVGWLFQPIFSSLRPKLMPAGHGTGTALTPPAPAPPVRAITSSSVAPAPEMKAFEPFST